ncbi:C-type lectin 10 [Aphelenchoides avenae]|nr:C-type lectin 10 [Aphelenchus avenae]
MAPSEGPPIVDPGPPGGSGANSCPPGWTHYWPSNKCFKVNVVAGLTTFEQQLESCKSQNGTLAAIHSAHEQRFVFNLTKQVVQLVTCKVWIGLCDITRRTVWQWSDGTAYDYTYWQLNQRDNKASNEFCVALQVRELGF